MVFCVYSEWKPFKFPAANSVYYPNCYCQQTIIFVPASIVFCRSVDIQCSPWLYNHNSMIINFLNNIRWDKLFVYNTIVLSNIVKGHLNVRCEIINVTNQTKALNLFLLFSSFSNFYHHPMKSSTSSIYYNSHPATNPWHHHHRLTLIADTTNGAII